jgi:hypothetical protein
VHGVSTRPLGAVSPVCVRALAPRPKVTFDIFETPLDLRGMRFEASLVGSRTVQVLEIFTKREQRTDETTHSPIVLYYYRRHIRASTTHANTDLIRLNKLDDPVLTNPPSRR